MRRRTALRLLALGGAGLLAPGFGLPSPARGRGPRRDAGGSRYGRWVVRDGLPAFDYDADQDGLPEAEWDPIVAPPTRAHWVMLGNRAIGLRAANDGTLALFDESHGLRWLVAADPTGTGVSLLDDDGRTWGSAHAGRAGARAALRTFGPTWFRVRDARAGLALERTVLCPEGEHPWVLVRVRLALAVDAPRPRAVRHVERWALGPRFLSLIASPAQRRLDAELAVSYAVAPTDAGLRADERFASRAAPGELGASARRIVGPPASLVLERLGRTPGTAAARAGDGPHPVLEVETPLVLRPGARRTLWFRFGRDDGPVTVAPQAIFAASLRGLRRRVPRARAARAPEAARELPWHAALLTGGAAVDEVIGGHTLDQGSAYSYLIGFNGAARDPLQHALPLVYSEPDLALSVLRNTCAWATPDGDLPYALDAAKRPVSLTFDPSDQNLWALWLAAEYAAASGDLAAFEAPLAYHPVHRTPAVPLREHLRRQFRFFVDAIGRGARDHVRIKNADWNDVAIAESGVPPDAMIAAGSSVLNSAMAAWVLPVFAGLADRLGDPALAAEARAEGDALRALVAAAWNGRWFHRAYAPGGGVVGDEDCWLEVQPWAILCGAADAAQAGALLDTLDRLHRAGSPLGTRLRAPLRVAAGAGEATNGGIWFSIDMTLVWAASRVRPAMAFDAWRRMTLAAHAAAYPAVWEGTLSGPDAFNAPESSRPGRTWGTPALAMQGFPVANLHSHAQPLLAYLRLLGVEPTPSGALAVGGGGSFRSAVFQVTARGHGRLRAVGPVTIESARGTRRGGPGRVRW